MAGTLVCVDVALGDVVAAGQTLATAEAMKMEHVLSAPHAGTVLVVHVAQGQPVTMHAPLIVVDATGSEKP